MDAWFVEGWMALVPKNAAAGMVKVLVQYVEIRNDYDIV